MSKQSKKDGKAKSDSKPDADSGSMLGDFENALEQAVADVPNVGQHPDARKALSEKLDDAQHEVEEAEKETEEAEADIRSKKAAGK